jgi:hypothetical protein
VRSQLNARVVRPRPNHRKPKYYLMDCVARELGVAGVFLRARAGCAAQRTTPLTPVAGAERLFTALRLHGWTMAIVTGAWKLAAAFKLTACSLPWETVPITTSEDGPARANIVRCARTRADSTHTLNSFEKLVSIGDGVWVVGTSRASGFPFIGVGREMRAE